MVKNGQSQETIKCIFDTNIILQYLSIYMWYVNKYKRDLTRFVGDAD